MKLSKRPRVLIGDDHSVVVDGLVKLLQEDYDIVGTAEDGRSLVRMALATHPDVVLADVSMPLLNGFEAARRIRHEWADTKVVFLTMHHDAAYLEEAVRVGGAGYVPKRLGTTELMAALKAVIRGQTYFVPVEAPGSAVMLGNQADFRSLTPRQREITQLIGEGKQNKEIAAILGVSPRTVEFHRAQIMNKLHVRSTAAIIKFAIDHGLASS